MKRDIQKALWARVVTFSSLAFFLVVTGQICSAIEQPESIDERSTHEHTRVIKIAEGNDDSMNVNAFCLGPNERIYAACGAGPGEVRVLDQTGKRLQTWRVKIKPEAIHATKDGSVLVAGEGKLFRFDSKGKVQDEAESPHAANLRANKDELRQEAISYLTRASNSLESRLAMYVRILEQLEEKAAKDELNEQEERTMELIPRLIDSFEKQIAKQPAKEKEEDAGPSDEAIKKQMDAMLKSKMRIASISTDGEQIFIATRALTGYGYAVWKLNQNFTGGEEIVTGLSGCCGQMDVQACKNGLFVAENSRHRVVRYDANGEEITKWGKQDRKGIEGFTSCCNPMNVCFDNKGNVFTAESSTGRIKQYSPEGELLSYIGDVKLVPGCKNVSIAVSKDQSEVFMLDLTRNHIVVMTQKSESEKDPAKTTAGGGE